MDTIKLGKRKYQDEQDGIIIGPKRVVIDVPENKKFIAIISKHEEINYKFDKPPAVFNGDAKDIRQWQRIRDYNLQQYGQLYDVVMADCPWNMKQDLPYSTLTDEEILNLPIELIQENGILVFWIVNAKKDIARKFFEQHGYKEADSAHWVKVTKNWNLHQGWGTYTTHCSETFMIGVKGNVNGLLQYHKAPGIIFKKITKHSQKPKQIYDFIQIIAPDLLNIELFARPQNIRNNWDSFGNELQSLENVYQYQD